MKQEVNAKAMPSHVPLPEHCMSVLVSTGELVEIVQGETTYRLSEYNTDNRMINRMIARRINMDKGICKQVEAAMRAGIVFGWHSKEADPANYDPNGNWIRQDKDEL